MKYMFKNNDNNNFLYKNFIIFLILANNLRYNAKILSIILLTKIYFITFLSAFRTMNFIFLFF